LVGSRTLPVATSVETSASYSAREANAWGMPAVGQRFQTSVR
jgi:hypothetical protein